MSHFFKIKENENRGSGPKKESKKRAGPELRIFYKIQNKKHSDTLAIISPEEPKGSNSIDIDIEISFK